jgi:hypothetical protein
MARAIVRVPAGERGFGQGLRITAGNSGLVVSGSTANENWQYGIYNAATGNTYLSNVMFGNRVEDAHDDAYTPGSWVDNSCTLDNQNGAICGTQ